MNRIFCPGSTVRTTFSSFWSLQEEHLSNSTSFFVVPDDPRKRKENESTIFCMVSDSRLVLLLFSQRVFLFSREKRMVSHQTWEIVVAHYKEPLQWLEPFKEHVVVYHKNPDGCVTHTFKKEIPLPNIGRESHTFLYHIVHNYDRLPDVTAFVQGKIDDHIPWFHVGYKSLPLLWLWMLVQQAWKNKGCSSPTRFSLMLFYLRFRLQHWNNQPLEPAPFRSFLDFFQNVSPDSRWYHGFWWNRGACIAVTYQALLSLVSHGNGGEMGHFMERSWVYVLNKAYRPTNILPAVLLFLVVCGIYLLL